MARHTARINVTTGYRLADVQAAITTRKSAMGRISWRAFGLTVGVNGSFLNSIVKGKRQPSPNVLRAFGFPVVRLVEVPDGYGVGRACAKCGKVHTAKRCTDGKRQPKPRMIQDMSRSELAAAFANREVMK